MPAVYAAATVQFAAQGHVTLMVGVKFTSYAFASAVACASIVYYALKTRVQFYAMSVFLATSKTATAVRV
jgi:hypothetical protein